MPFGIFAAARSSGSETHSMATTHDVLRLPAIVVVLHSQLWQLVLASTVTGAWVILCPTAAPSLLIRHVPQHATGQTNGLNSFARSLGTTTSSAVIGAVLTSVLIQQ